MSASHKRAADSTSVSSTARRSKVERLMTLSTSAVAVCCCKDSVSSRVRAFSASNRRTFSIAITAWSAKVWSSTTCLSENGATRSRATTIAPMAAPSCSMGTARAVRYPIVVPIGSVYSRSWSGCSPSRVCRQASGRVRAPTNAIERLHEELKRRIKTQTELHSGQHGFRLADRSGSM